MSTEISNGSAHGGMTGELTSRSNFVESQARGEVDQQIATAKRFPRSVKRFKEAALSLATLDEDTAASCFYTVPRDNKMIEGPSARLAEIVAASWGNLRVTASIVDEDASFVTARGMAWDLENNVAVATEVRRRITNKSGKRYSDDMIITTSNAACSIALRNALFKVVPFAMVRPIYLEAKKLAIGDATTLVKKRTDMVAAFGKMGVVPAQVLLCVNKPSLDDVTVDDLATLRGLYTAIKDGDTSIEEAFPTPEKTAPKADAGKSKSDKLAADLAAKAAGEKAAPKPEAKSETGVPPVVDQLNWELQAISDAKGFVALRTRIIKEFEAGTITADESSVLQELIHDKRAALGLDK